MIIGSMMGLRDQMRQPPVITTSMVVTTKTILRVCLRVAEWIIVVVSGFFSPLPFDMLFVPAIKLFIAGLKPLPDNNGQVLHYFTADSRIGFQ